MRLALGITPNFPFETQTVKRKKVRASHSFLELWQVYTSESYASSIMEQEDVDRRVAAILDEAQNNSANHARLMKDLTQLCEVAGAKLVLRNSIMQAVLKVLVVFKREPAVERVVSFLISFVSQCLFKLNDIAFPVYFMTKLLPYTKASKGARDTELSKAVRFRSTQLVAGVLNALSEETEIKYVQATFRFSLTVTLLMLSLTPSSSALQL